MHLHEYQAKAVLKRYGVEVTAFGVASNESEVDTVIENLGLDKAVIKVQVHAGGRGKAGGVKFANSKAAAAIFSSKISLSLLSRFSLVFKTFFTFGCSFL